MNFKFILLLRLYMKYAVGNLARNFHLDSFSFPCLNLLSMLPAIAFLIDGNCHQFSRELITHTVETVIGFPTVIVATHLKTLYVLIYMNQFSTLFQRHCVKKYNKLVTKITITFFTIRSSNIDIICSLG